jgi:predicted O-methyltransferase YrrM
LPARVAERVGLIFLRAGSSQWRAFTDFSVPPFDGRRPWPSGLGTGVHLLYGLVRSARPCVVVEIGSAQGRSTCAMALACRQNGQGKVHAIDPHTENSWSEGNGVDTFAVLKSRLAEYDLAPWCQVMRMTSAEAARDWRLPIDILFIDGDHTFEGVRHDFEAFRPWLTARSLVVFHDTLWEYEPADTPRRPNIGVPQYLEQLRAEGYHSVTIPAPYGMTIVCPAPGGFPLMPGGLPGADSECAAGAHPVA